MSKTVDELIGVYIEASNAVVWEAEKRGLCPMTLDMQRAGIAAVVRAVRDEFGRIMYPGDDWNRQGILEQFEVILGDTAEARSAGVLAVESREGAMISEAPEAPATDPAPAVCVWTPQDEGPAHEIWKTGCGTMYERAKSTGWCNKCKAPIKFTEAKT